MLTIFLLSSRRLNDFVADCNPIPEWLYNKDKETLDIINFLENKNETLNKKRYEIFQDDFNDDVADLDDLQHMFFEMEKDYEEGLLI